MPIDFGKLLRDLPSRPPDPRDKLKRVTVNAQRTSAWGEKKKTVVQCQLLIEENGALTLEGGVTGYESVAAISMSHPDTISDLRKGWWACAGTPGRWDSLFIPADEMNQALDQLLIKDVSNEGTPDAIVSC